MDIVEILMKKGVNGLIISNMMMGYCEVLKSCYWNEVGGFLGVLFMFVLIWVFVDFYWYMLGEFLLVGVGGILSGSDVYEKI